MTKWCQICGEAVNCNGRRLMATPVAEMNVYSPKGIRATGSQV